MQNEGQQAMEHFGQPWLNRTSRVEGPIQCGWCHHLAAMRAMKATSLDCSACYHTSCQTLEQLWPAKHGLDHAMRLNACSIARGDEQKFSAHLCPAAKWRGQRSPDKNPLPRHGNTFPVSFDEGFALQVGFADDNRIRKLLRQVARLDHRPITPCRTRLEPPQRAHLAAVGEHAAR